MKKLVSLFLALMMSFALTMPALAYTAGTYTGEGQGNNGPIKVEVTFSEDQITGINVVEHGETPGICDPAMERIPAAILEQQSLAVDTVSGATNSSRGILAAIEAAAVQAGADVDALKAAPAEEAAVEKVVAEISTDVLVVGGGVAGFAAALSAKEQGADVIIIDKMAAVGGTTNLAGGLLISVNSEVYKDAKMEADSLEAVLEYWKGRQAASGIDSGYPDWERLENVLADTGKTVDWLISNDIEFGAEPYAGSPNYPVAAANGGGSGLIKMELASAEARGIKVITECKATELVLDDAGAVIGVKAEGTDTNAIFHAKSVVLCTGGISQNQELVAKYSPKLTRAGLIPTSAVSHTGDGFLMALEAGAGTFAVFGTPLFATMVDPELAALTDTSAISIYSQLGVNADGVRFGNEAGGADWDSYDRVASDMIQNGKAPFWYIFDSSNPDVVAQLGAGVPSGIVAKGDTVEELALGMHVYTDALKASCEAYGKAVSEKNDAEFGKAEAFLVPIEQAPFYAVRVYPTTFGSSGGVTTTEDGRVTRQDGTVIPGLYAAGEMSNRYFYNENYILAASLGLYSTMGRRAGAAAAMDAAAK